MQAISYIILSFLCVWLQLIHLLAAVDVTATSSTTPPTTDQQYVVQLNCLNESKVEMLRQARIEAIKQEILYKLNLELPPSETTEDEQPTLDTMASLSAYQALLHTTNEDVAQPQECHGKDNTFYSKRIQLYSPSSFVAEVPPVEAFEWGYLFKEEIEVTTDSPDYKTDITPDDDVLKEETKQDAYTNVPQTTESYKYPEIDGRPLDEYVSPLTYRLTFSPPDEPLSLARLHSAHLQLFKRKIVYDSLQIKQDSNPQEMIQIYQRVLDDGKDAHSVLITTKLVSAQSDAHERFNITKLIMEWLDSNKSLSNLELEVRVRTSESITSGKLFLPSIEFDTPGFTEKAEHDAKLVLTLLHENELSRATNNEHNRTVRKKRNSHNGVNPQHCRDNPSEPNCCLREFHLNFRRDLGWNWVLAPQSFQANYCQGLCPAYWPSATMATNFLIRYRETNPTGAPEPCCIPSSLKPLTMLMVINGRILLNELPDMRVEACICR